MESNHPDIFDRIMTFPGLRKFTSTYQKHKAILLYLFFGGLTTLISIGSYILLDSHLGISPLISNIFSWILAVSFAYITNRIWVFASQATGKAAIQEISAFLSGRLATLGFEEIIILIFVEILNYNSSLIKVLAQILVLVLNYIISKLLVFKN